MNPVAEEILSFMGVGGTSAPKQDEFLAHYGKKRRSGRYPWGSGDNPYQHSGDFLSRVDQLKKTGMSETEICKILSGELGPDYMDSPLSSTELRAYKAIAKAQREQLAYDTAKSMRDDGKTYQEIAAAIGKPEATVRYMLNNEQHKINRSKSQNTADILKKTLSEKDAYLDIGEGVERELGISKEKMNEAVVLLESEGYKVYSVGQAQVTNPGQQTIVKALCPPGTEYKDVYPKINNPGKPYYDPDKPIGVNLNKPIVPVNDYISYDGGESFRKAFEYPSSMDSSRLAIRYAEDGGKERDGLIELRRGCKDLDLGNSNYAQVRIMVDGTHYIKGMAVYADDLPDGVDVRFNTNKTRDKSKMEVLKKINTADPNNPFGSLIKDAEHGGQYYYDDPDGKFTDPVTGKKQSLGLINKRADEGDWGEWADKLPAQFLAKQNKKLIQSQLDMAFQDSEDEFNEICSLTIPTVKKKLLTEFASDCDGKAESLAAAALPGQKYQVILPNPEVKDAEIYAPNYADGDTVALVRYPHGGTFEIPILKVNNKITDAEKMITATAADAVVINHKTAERLSGADFDGDTVMVIPCNSSRSSVKITSKEPLRGLEGFDPEKEYPPNPKVKPWSKGGAMEQKQMGMVSNLITDMTLQNATDEELARAVRHSMVVIDVAKHGYDYKKSETDNGIPELKSKYQGHYDEKGKWRTGASTLISKAGAEYTVDKRKGAAKTNSPDKPWYDPSRPLGAEIYSTPKVNKKGESWYDASKPEGSVIYVKNRETYIDKKGKEQVRTQKSTWMAETDDAKTLISRANTYQENQYATYANKQKSLANRARMEALATPTIEYSAAANKKYYSEYRRLKSEVDLAKKNAPRERQAQRMAKEYVDAQVQNNPDITNGEIKKMKQRALTEARNKVGAKRRTITITDKEWEAINAGAISDTLLSDVLKYADMDVVRQKAMPKQTKTVSDAKINKAKNMKAMGYTNEQIARAIGVSTSSVSDYINQ